MVRRIFTGIGSRQTPKALLDIESEVAKRLANKNHIIRSGGAMGADQAFARGVRKSSNPDNLELFLPWEGFEGNYKITKNPDLFFSDLSPEEQELFHKILQEVIEPRHYDNIMRNPSARNLHGRNMLEVLGRPDPEGVPSELLVELMGRKFRPSDAVLYSAPTRGGEVLGGTASAVELAHSLKIPNYNLYEDGSALNKLLERFPDLKG